MNRWIFTQALDMIVPSVSQIPHVNNNLYEVALERAAEVIMNEYDHIGESLTKIIVSAYKCIAKPKQLICHEKHIELYQCMRPVQKIFDKALGTKYEAVARLMINSLISAKNYICNAKLKEILEIVNPCINLNSEAIMKCWEKTIGKYVKPEEIVDIKDEYCKDFQETEDCTIEVMTKNCENFSTRESLSNFYKTLFIYPCSIY
ncbi:uncharacterized protein LOC123679625 isoform X2 [Harmonia axyridis]|uniref:uncharacterized protein LOC123679625 isoform X2 n=1 Tax=Harmonia axyridis TaxID=115357 RepID=UPI001E279334|nr:uncharacterized protein LOC123679625 isoform X2 [Harmonia axyridis]